MRYILRQRERVVDEWRYLHEEVLPDSPLIVPWPQLRAEPERWRNHAARLGTRLSPGDPVEELAGELAHLALIAVEFPSPGEGRGYSQGRLLRERLNFSGELRAVGEGVRQDQIFLLSRCGFDAFELATGEDVQAARHALERYEVAYQPGAALVPLRRQRFFA